LILCSGTIIAQSPVTVNTNPQKANCQPTKACAEKMGMTLEECKAICNKVCTSKTSVAENTDKSNANLVSIASSDEKTSCCASLEECAKAMGMTIEECKAKCATAISDGMTKVASASLESDASSTAQVPNSKKTCNKTSAKCCSKKAN